MNRDDLAALVLLAALWGGSFLFMRVSAPAVGPLVVACARVVIAGLALLLYAAARRQVPAWRGYGRRFLLVGALNCAVPFTLISFAELHLTASLAAIFNATTPLFAVLVATLLLRERLTLRKGLGVLVGLVGVAILVGWSPLRFGPLTLLSVGASLLAALSYALAGLYARRTLSGLPALTLTIGQLCGASALLLPPTLPLALATAPTWRLSGAVILAMLALALLSSSLAYLLYFRLLTNVGATGALSVTFLVPIFGLLWSALFLHESLHVSTLVGLAVVLSSIVLVVERVTPRAVARERDTTQVAAR